MGSYTFTWEHPASEVYVTGEFDQWKKTVQLEKEDGIFKKTVELPKTKTPYKFVVDGNWVTNESHPKEDDGKGNYNNVLNVDEIKDEPVHTLSSAAPQSTTAALAGAVPKESEKSKSDESIPGAFPETPAATPGLEKTLGVNPIPATEGLGNPVKLAPGEKVPDPSTLTSNTVDSTVKHDKEPEEEKEQAFGVAPIPASSGLGNPISLAPGEKVPDSSTFNSNSVESTVKHDKEPEKEAQSFGVTPIPATAGAGNPIHLAPGEKVPDPSTLTSNTISSTAKTDAASYEKSDTQPPQLGPVVTPDVEREAKGGMFGLPPISNNLIPESSLPKDTSAESAKDPGVTIQSAAPTSTTAALAGDVPKEPRVPQAVKESQKEADFAPEASANPTAVDEKKEVEQELKQKVPEEPPAAESSTAEKVGVAAGASAAAAVGAGTYLAYSAKDAKDKAAETVGLNGKATASDVPEPVKESQKEAHAEPEASANPEAVEEKKAVENELLSEVKKTNEAGEPAPTLTAATSETAPGLSEEALTDVKPLKSSSEPDALNAPASKPAVPETSKPAEPLNVPEPAKPVDSRDVSPMSKQPTQPTVTTGVESSTTATKTEPKASETPKKEVASSSKDTPESVASGATDKKKKRRSIFGKLKDKLHI